MDWVKLAVMGTVSAVVLVCVTVLVAKGIAPLATFTGAIGTVMGLLGGLFVDPKKGA